jgi:hypothetical protein
MSALINGDDLLRPQQQQALLQRATPQLLQRLLACEAVLSQVDSGDVDVLRYLCELPAAGELTGEAAGA